MNGQSSKHKCCGIVQEAAMRSRERRDKRANKPQSWIARKCTVGITIGIMVYAFYVYIGRFCAPMIRKTPSALGSRAMGVAFLVVFCILWLMMLWAYAKVVLTSPGYAKHHVSKSPSPIVQNPTPTWWGEDSDPEDVGGAVYQPMTSPSENPWHSPPNENGYGSFAHQAPPQIRSKELSSGQQIVGKEDAQLGAADPTSAITDGHISNTPSASFPSARNETLSMYTRKPPALPSLRPEHRYCRRDGFVKPFRAHHCRACGTCVLRYDHHCPWIGQCVGARNHRFFFIFNEWAFVFCLWTFATLLARNVHPVTMDTDPEHVVIIALAGLFAIFTYALILTHIHLLIMNFTTVESLGIQRMKEREDSVLSHAYPWYAIRAKRAMKRQWDKKWGKIDEDGNLWWLGSARQNWESVMGHSVWEWFLPFGRSPCDGLTYARNPRFTDEGQWKPRTDGPAQA